MTSILPQYEVEKDLEKQACRSLASPTESRSPTLHENRHSVRELTDEEFKREIKPTITIPLGEYPRGYPLQAAFQSSEPSWSIYRAFGYLHSRVILELQDELRELEKRLKDLDTIHSSDPDEDISDRVRSRRSDLKQGRREGEKGGSRRASLVGMIRDKLLIYDETLIKAREVNAFQRPTNRDYTSVRTWFWGESPLNNQIEWEFVKKREDLISLRRTREWSKFDGAVENCIRFMHRRLHFTFLQKIFATQELRDKTIGSDGSIYYYSHERIEKLVGVLITTIIFVLLVLPIVAMYKLTSAGESTSTFDAVGVLVVFTLLFSAALSLLTKAQRHELFAASAAYAAVLVVFISNFNNDAISIGVGSNGGRGG
ncbi:hypothetical protein C7974DRAFT_419015 [Boeremia exigua]|uniref:uncharacterized protein n=1 Tax=Boeremia exigua TaxID=749465 RepID=UPI001E8EA33F|nr:uncharacterized protein C7974DRAFT_419015 [Boeremia exigua]KAH6612117.1 hypothetical protein C7974DRAFT_419015 [Boeremia exigua]